LYLNNDYDHANYKELNMMQVTVLHIHIYSRRVQHARWCRCTSRCVRYSGKIAL